MDTIDPIALSPERPCHVQASQIANGMTLVAAALVLSAITLNLTTYAHSLMLSGSGVGHSSSDTLVQIATIINWISVIYIPLATKGLDMASPVLPPGILGLSRHLNTLFTVFVTKYLVCNSFSAVYMFTSRELPGYISLMSPISWWASLIFGALYACVLLRHYLHQKAAWLAVLAAITFGLLAYADTSVNTTLSLFRSAPDGFQIDPLMEMPLQLFLPIVTFVSITLTTLAFRKTMADRGDIPM